MTDYLNGASKDGTVLGQTTDAKIGFWGITPVNQPDAPTAQLDTTITISATATVSVSTYTTFTTAGYGFCDYPEAMTFVKVIQNLQSRSGEIEAALVEVGLVAGGTAISDEKLYDFVGKGDDTGSILGQTTSDKFSFWGVDPCDQPGALLLISTTSGFTVTVALTTNTITATIEGLVTASVGFGPVDFEQGYTLLNTVKNLQTRIGQIETNLTEVGILATTTAGISITTSAKLDFLDKGKDDGTILGYASSHKVGFWGTTPVDQPAALTALTLTGAIATIEVTGTATYVYTTALQGFTIGTVTGYKFTSVDAANTVLHSVKRLWDRTAEMEALLEEVGLIASN